jgi:hypothetical protein
VPQFRALEDLREGAVTQVRVLTLPPARCVTLDKSLSRSALMAKRRQEGPLRVGTDGGSGKEPRFSYLYASCWGHCSLNVNCGSVSHFL